MPAWRRIGAWRKLSQFNGQPADLIGFVYSEPTFGGDHFMVARFAISCCVADASAIGVPVAALDSVSLDFDLPPVPAAGHLTSAEARSATLRSRTDILGALAEYAASQSALQLEIAKQYPDLHLGPGYAWNAGSAGDNEWSLGLTLERLGQLEAARVTYQATLEAYVRVQGKRGRAVADLRGHLADIAFKLGDPAGAHALYVEALAIMRKQPGPEDPDTLELVSRDATTLTQLGKKIAARNLARTVVDGYRRTLGEENPLTVRAKARLEAIGPSRPPRQKY